MSQSKDKAKANISHWNLSIIIWWYSGNGFKERLMEQIEEIYANNISLKVSSEGSLVSFRGGFEPLLAVSGSLLGSTWDNAVSIASPK